MLPLTVTVDGMTVDHNKPIPPGEVVIDAPKLDVVGVNVTVGYKTFGKDNGDRYHGRGKFAIGPLGPGKHVVQLSDSQQGGRQWFGLQLDVRDPQTDGPRVGNGQAKPAAPNLPDAKAKPASQPGEKLESPVNFGGATVTHVPPDAGQALFDVTKPSAAVRQVRLQGDRDKGLLANVGAPDFVAEDVAVLDNAGECFVVRKAARGFALRRAVFETMKRYAVFNEGAESILIEDVAIEDTGDDGVAGTADDDGGSTTESCLRFSGGGGTLRRVRVVYAGKSRKATVRGFGTYHHDDCYYAGAMASSNPLGGGDGGRAWLLTCVLTKRIVYAANPDETRAAVFAAVAAGETEAMALAKAFRSAAKVWVDPDDKAKGTKPLEASDAQLRTTIERRASDLSSRAASTWTRTTIDFGFQTEAGSDAKFDDTCVIRGDEQLNHGFALDLRPGEYPEAASKGDAGWRLPYDALRPEGRILLDGTRLYGKQLYAGATEAEARRMVRGKFYFNDAVIDWSAA